jgi:hypothetical protein
VLLLCFEIFLMRAGDSVFRQTGNVVVYVYEQRHVTILSLSVAARCDSARRRFDKG